MIAGLILKIKLAWKAWKWLSEVEKRGVNYLTVAQGKDDRVKLEDWLFSLSDGKDMGRLERLLQAHEIGRHALLYGQTLIKSRRIGEITGEPDLQYLTKVEVGKFLPIMDQRDLTWGERRQRIGVVVRDITEALSTGRKPYPGYGRIEG